MSKISEYDEVGEDLVDADDIVVAHESATKRSLLSRIATYVQGKLFAASDVAGALADDDEFIFTDTSDSSAQKTSALSRIKTWLFATPEIGGALADADTILITDASGSVQKTALLSRVYTYLVAKGLVADTRLLSGTSPIRVGGGASADLSADRAISILAASASDDGYMSSEDFSKLGLITSGTWTPTFTGISNASTFVNPVTHRYHRIGDHVFATGAVGFTPASTGTATFRLSLPVATDVDSSSETRGYAGSSTTSFAGQGWCFIDSTTDELSLSIQVATASAFTVYYGIIYPVQ